MNFTCWQTHYVNGLRTDIQALRAIGVGAVLVYHVLPDSLTGGYVGVDVFFVISGFLITSHLIAKPPERASDLIGFWARRARRLLPAALLVLVATLIATRLLAPETLWDQTARQTMGAAVYAVNWFLAADSVDYLAAENPPTGVQHYWSLSVEEQFYLFWPLLIMGLASLAGHRWSRRVVWAVGIGAVIAASLTWSIQLTATDPGRAYFITTTRMWELATGGLIAVLVVLFPQVIRSTGTASAARAVLAWSGLAAIAYATTTFDGQTPFPSWRAAIPVLGTAAIIFAQSDHLPGSPGRLLSLRPFQWLGDISYSVYLWHWPIVVLVSAHIDKIGVPQALAIIAASLVLAQLTTTYVENPFRTASWNFRHGQTYRLAAAGMASVLVLGAAQAIEVDRRSDQEAARVSAQVDAAGACLGAGALDPELDCAPAKGPVVPAPAQAALDRSDAYESNPATGRDCRSVEPDYSFISCKFGDTKGSVDVVLVGNSHAAQWLPTLQEIAAERGWRVTTYLAAGCGLLGTRMKFSTVQRAANCEAWGEQAIDTIVADKPDLVVLSNRLALPSWGHVSRSASIADYETGYLSVLDRFADAKIPVAAVRDTPTPVDGGREVAIPTCLSQEGEASKKCDGSRSAWVLADPITTAVEKLTTRRPESVVGTIDLNDRICTGERCPAVVGGVVVYFDASHLTATYARTLAAPFTQALGRAGLLPAG